VQEYIDRVCDGTLVTGRLERLAVWRHVDDLKNAGERGFYFDPVRAEKAIEFSKLCRHYEGEWANKPLNLRPEQKFIVWCLMGWRQTSDGLRRYRQAQIEIARKGGKSLFASFFACLLLYADSPFEEGAQGYIAATKQEQAVIVWKASQKMIERSPILMRKAKITPCLYKIELPESDSIFRPLAADKTPDGFNPHFIIKDEEHAWREQHRSQSETLGSGFGARSQPITITITTYGTDESTIWLENHDYAIRCLESVITGEIVDDTWFAMILALDYPLEKPCVRCKGDDCPWCDGTGTITPDDPYEERVWRKANPGIGLGAGFTPKLERMRDSARLASQRLDKESEFFQKNLNIIVSSRNKAITPEAWAASKGELSGMTTVTGFGGIDLGRSDDFASIAMVFPFHDVDDNDEAFTRYECITKTWTVHERSEPLKTSMIERWVELGYLLECSGGAVTFQVIQEAILEWHKEYSIRTWAYDKTFAPQLAQNIESEGLEPFAFGQSHKFYTAPIVELLKCVGKSRKVNGVDVPLWKHDGNPCLAWQAGNLVIDTNLRDEKMPVKGQPVNKIDSMVAILMALSECLYHDGEGAEGYYLNNSLAVGGKQ
jgi:phage terminase large subunit-like protein